MKGRFPVTGLTKLTVSLHDRKYRTCHSHQDKDTVERITLL